jgi:hypothetical protein
MSDLWEGEGFGAGDAASAEDGDDDWAEGEESLEAGLEDALDDPDELEDESWDESEEE